MSTKEVIRRSKSKLSQEYQFKMLELAVHSCSTVEKSEWQRVVIERFLFLLGTFYTNGFGEEAGKPQIKAEDSVHDDYIICLEDGRKLRTLTRHLMSKYDMTPEQYKIKWGLPYDYPMSCRNYTRLRKKISAGARRLRRVRENNEMG